MQLDQRQRTAVLGAAAAILVVVALVRLLGGRGTVEPVGPVAPGKPRDVAAVTTSSRAGGPLAARYKPIVDADPFRVLRFDRHGGRPGGGRDERPRDEPERSSSSARLVTLRLTGVAEEGSSTKTLAAVLEDRVGNRGVIVKKGDKLGDRSIAEVRTDSIVLAPPKTIALGEPIEMPVEAVEKQLGPLGPPKASEPGKEPPAVLTDDQKEDVLKKLRARRQASMGAVSNPPPSGEDKK